MKHAIANMSSRIFLKVVIIRIISKFLENISFMSSFDGSCLENYFISNDTICQMLIFNLISVIKTVYPYKEYMISGKNMS